MSERMKPMGMDRSLATKMGAKYDTEVEIEVRNWINQVTGQNIGEGMMNVERSLRNGITLIKLLQKLFDETSNLPPAAKNFQSKLKYSESETPFKQMENIEVFLKGAQAYGVPRTSLFQTVDLYEGRNLPMVLASILQVGTEAQRHGFRGPTAGSKPVESQKRTFSYEQLKSGHGVIGLQSGSNKFATQKGMRIGSVRHVSDIKADDQVKEGQTMLTLQAGTNKFASQKGMSMGSVRHIADIRCDEFDQRSSADISLQSGTNKFDSQRGMTAMGAVRHISDIRCDDYVKESAGDISLQSGTNKFDSQKGMTSMGAVRHISDIRCDDYARDSANVISLQYGTNQYDSQRGMTSFGAQRHISDIPVRDLAEEYAPRPQYVDDTQEEQ